MKNSIGNKWLYFYKHSKIITAKRNIQKAVVKVYGDDESMTWLKRPLDSVFSFFITTVVLSSPPPLLVVIFTLLSRSGGMEKELSDKSGMSKSMSSLSK